MNVSKEQKKQRAIELMKKLDIYKPYIQGFAKHDKVCFYENYGGFWAYQEPELIEKIKEFEEKFNAIVYAVTHEYLEFGECYDFLYVSDYQNEWADELSEVAPDKFYINAYVWNKDDDWCSEFGTIGIRSYGGGIKRFA